jgi:hypothetical protein
MSTGKVGQGAAKELVATIVGRNIKESHEGLRCVAGPPGILERNIEEKHRAVKQANL